MNTVDIEKFMRAAANGEHETNLIRVFAGHAADAIKRLRRPLRWRNAERASPEGPSQNLFVLGDTGVVGSYHWISGDVLPIWCKGWLYQREIQELEIDP